MTKRERQSAIEWLLDGNTPEDLANQLLDLLPPKDLQEILKEIKDSDE